MKKTLLILIIVVTLIQANHMLIPINYRFGTETIALGETGVGFSNTIETHLYNPANSALFGAERKVKLALSGGFEHIMPTTDDQVMNFNGTIGYFIPLFDSSFHLAAIFTGSYLSLEKTLETFPMPIFEDVTQGTVNWDMFTQTYTWGISLSWLQFLSLGIDLKYYTGEMIQIDSDTTEISEISNVDYEARYVSMNLGIRGQYQFDLSPKFFIKPSAGFSLLNSGKDSVHLEAVNVRYDSFQPTNDLSSKEPVHASMLFGGAVTVGQEDVIWGSIIYDNYRDLGTKSPYKYTTHSFGLQVNTTPIFAINTGLLFDQNSEQERNRKELHWGITVGYRSDAMNRFYLARNSSKQLKTKLKNIELLYSCALIHSLDSNFPHRDLQHSHQITFAMDFGKSKSSEVKVNDSESELGLE